jgi:DNA helicase-2/ATP-dependent DNA helicase PcrA
LAEIPESVISWNTVTSSLKPRTSAPRSFGPPPRATGKKVESTIVLEVGDRVSHDTFGLGKVVAVNGSGDRAEATIDFGSSGEKRLLLRYAPVERL